MARVQPSAARTTYPYTVECGRWRLNRLHELTQQGIDKPYTNWRGALSRP